MHKKIEQSLINKFPSLYNKNSKFECENGWLTLIETFSELIVARSKETFLVHAKEGYGQLLIEVSGYQLKDYFYIFGLTNMSFSLSQLICEKCGKKGYLFNSSGKINARCKNHGGLLLTSPEFRVPSELPFKLKNIGTAWHEMIADFYNQILMHVRGNEMPEVSFECIEKRNERLYIKFSGGDETVNGMIDLLVAYTAIIDHETGKILGKPINFFARQ